jgi:hypothetical protein
VQVVPATLREASGLGTNLSRLIEFYQGNPDRFLVPRPARDFEDAILRGQQFFVEVGGAIRGSCGIFDYATDLPYVELSETLVLPPLRGHGLQRFFGRLRVASVVWTQGPRIGITTAVDPHNARSVANVTAQGFERWNAVPAAYETCGSCPNKPVDQKCCCDFYELPTARARALVAQFLDETAQGSVVLDGAPRVSRLAVDCSACFVAASIEAREALREFVAGALW